MQTIEAAALPLVFATAQRKAAEAGLSDYLSWLSFRRQQSDGRIAWDTDEASRQRAYIANVNGALTWRAQQESINRGNAGFMAALAVPFQRGVKP